MDERLEERSGERLNTGWRFGLRTRLVALGAAGVAVALLGSGIVLVAVLQFGLERTIDAAAGQTARDVAALVDAEQLPDPIPAGGTTIVQVVDARGRVRAASAGGDRLVPTLTADEIADVRAGEHRYLPGYRFGVRGVVRVAAVPAGGRADPQTVIVAVPAADVAESVHLAAWVLGIGYVVLLAVLTALAWRMVGAALHPVDALRRAAEEITGTRSAARLPVPRAQDELHRLALTLNDMLGRLDGARARQRAFVADAAHELRSPLASLRTQAEVAAAVGLPDDPAEFLDDVLTDVARLSRLVDDLLLLARADDGPPPGWADAEPVDLTAVAVDVVERHAAARVPVTLRSGAEPVVRGDRDQLTRALDNLVENAVRHAAGQVEVRVGGCGPAGVTVDVIDDGPGVPATDRERVFGRFVRLDTARDRDRGGAGLGLAIVRELVARHGGTVTLGGNDGSPGLRASIRLPCEAPR